MMIPIFVVTVIVIVFRLWFTPVTLSGGDWEYLFPQSVHFSPIISAWYPFHGNGLGNVSFASLWVEAYYRLFTSFFVGTLHWPWWLVERLFVFWPLILFGCIGSYVLFRRFFRLLPTSFAWIALCMYVFNTYSMSVIGGGQMGVALAIMLAPISLYFFVSLCEKIETVSFREKIQSAIILAWVISIQIMVDLRIAYLTLGALALYIFLYVGAQRVTKKTCIELFGALGFTGIVTVLFHSYWIIPTILSRYNPTVFLGSAYTSIESVRFFSFADFAHSFSLLHPNWPENIFGKVYFLYPVYLLIPLCAFLSLRFIVSSQKVDAKKKSFLLHSIYCVFLSLIGSFLAKGTNEPFGFVYEWLFQHIPGFVMFRDPTKFYLYIILGYSMLVPIGIHVLYEYISQKIKRIPRYLIERFVLIGCIVLILISIRTAVFSTYLPMFQTRVIPQDYIAFANLLSQEKDFGRTLWVPKKENWGYYSAQFPAIDFSVLTNESSPAGVARWFSTKENQELLKRLSVKYIVVPSDMERSIFVTDRMYDPQYHEAISASLSAVPYIARTDKFGSIESYEVNGVYKQIFNENTKDPVLHQQQSLTRIDVELESSTAENVFVLSQRYHPGWKLIHEEGDIHSEETKDHLNAFRVPSNSEHVKAKIEFSPQTFVERGSVISVVTFVLSVLTFALTLSWKKLLAR